MTDPSKPCFLRRADAERLAYHATPGKSPGIVFLSGFMSDMTGTKATALEEYCRKEGRAFLRFDYFGHGQSSGKFEEGTIGRWRGDALAVLDELTEGPQILVGSSMGGWIALLLALARPERLRGLVLIAAAPDFTDKMMWANFSEAERETLRRDGILYQPSGYGPAPYAISLNLIEEGRRHNLLDGPIQVSCPVRLFQGMRDRDVPFEWALKIVDRLAASDVVLSLVKEGDHRLSAPADLARLFQAVNDLSRD
jgi:pimeloyl-ACP methyl ester carboxylesterase